MKRIGLIILTVGVIAAAFDLCLRTFYQPTKMTKELDFSESAVYSLQINNRGTLYLNHNKLEIAYESNSTDVRPGTILVELLLDSDGDGTFEPIGSGNLFAFPYDCGMTGLMELPYSDRDMQYQIRFTAQDPTVKAATVHLTMDYISNSFLSNIHKRLG